MIQGANNEDIMNSKDSKVLLEAITSLLKDNAIVQELFKKFDVPLEKIDSIPIEFQEMEVSAKTKKGKIYINESLLSDGDFSEDVHYIVHEIVHWLQQIYGDKTKYPKSNDVHYLDLPSEIEAFKYQIKFIGSFQSADDAEQYVSDLLDFHEFKGEDRAIKASELNGD